MADPDPADPRRVTRAVITAFTRGPATHLDSGDRWDVQFFDARGNPAAPRRDYPTRADALSAVSRLADRVGYSIPVEWAPPPASLPTTGD